MKKESPKEKVCTDCKILKPIEDYRLVSKKTGYIRSYCKVCENKRRDEYRRTRDPNKEKLRKRRLQIQYEYKLPYESYLQMLEDQQYTCKICPNKLDKPCVDHCHKSNIIRGLLCTSCNTGLGMFKDNIDLLKSAISYLEESTKKCYISSRL